MNGTNCCYHTGGCPDERLAAMSRKDKLTVQNDSRKQVLTCKMIKSAVFTIIPDVVVMWKCICFSILITDCVCGISPPTGQEIRQIFQWVGVWVGKTACWTHTNMFSGLWITNTGGLWCDISGVTTSALFHRTKSVIGLDPSRQFHIFCHGAQVLWCNPITRQAQREIRGLCQSSLQTESLSLETPGELHIWSFWYWSWLWFLELPQRLLCCLKIKTYW